MPHSAPFVSEPLDIEKDWIDYNGHLNMAYYNVLFDRGADRALDILGIGASYARERRMTIYTAEVHVCYVQELHLDHKVKVSFHLLDYDEKRLRAYQEIRHVDGWLAATSEILSLHVDLSGPKVVPFPTDIMRNIQAMAAAHAALPTPQRAGNHIDIANETGLS